jgi:hypothetical protein
MTGQKASVRHLTVVGTSIWMQPNATVPAHARKTRALSVVVQLMGLM